MQIYIASVPVDDVALAHDFADGSPVTQFLSADVEREYSELTEKGVHFTMMPTNVGPSIIAVFDDTVGNLIQLVQLKK